MDLNMFPLGETVHQRLERLERQVWHLLLESLEHLPCGLWRGPTDARTEALSEKGEGSHGGIELWFNGSYNYGYPLVN